MGLLKKDKKADRFKSKEEVREEKEKVSRGIIADKMDIKGGFTKPHWRQIQMAIFPLTTYRWSAFYISWLWRLGIRREEYSREEQLYVIRKNLWVSQGQFNQIEEEEVEDMPELELWEKEKFKVWKAENDAEMRIKEQQWWGQNNF